MNYDDRHGGPFDRGRADAYYGRTYNPHYFVEDTYSSPRVDLGQMTPEEIVAYTHGYETTTDRKDYGDFM